MVVAELKNVKNEEKVADSVHSKLNKPIARDFDFSSDQGKDDDEVIGDEFASGHTSEMQS